MHIVVASRNPVKVDATRRAFNELFPDVGLEVASVEVESGRSESISEARSVTLPLPPAVRELVDSGLELGDANDRVFATLNSKQGGGACGLLTDGLYTRESVYRQTLIIELTPFVNSLYPNAVKCATGTDLEYS